MKTPTPQRVMDLSAMQRGAKRKPVVREQIPLSNLPDCLLAAYDGVSRRAFERFVARGSKAGSEIADWRTAERDLFLPVTVDFQDTQDALYALATTPGVNGSQIAVAIEDRWLLISGHVDPPSGWEDDMGPSPDPEPRPQKLRWIDWDGLYRVLKDHEANDEILCDESDDAAGEPATPAQPRPFCVVELPVEVDVSRSIVVLADGLIAVRMPKPRAQARGELLGHKT